MAKIILVGYMGVGKTSVGYDLSQKTLIPFFDLDDLIVQQTKLSISEIFEQKGEIWFRKTEHLVLKNFLNTNEHFILGLGGGTPCYGNNHLFLKEENISSIYLKASIPALIANLSSELDSRPILKSIKTDLPSFIGPHLFERSYFYNFAKDKISVDKKSIDEISTEIINLLKLA